MFRHRGATAVPFAVLLVWGARPAPASWLCGGLVILLGQVLRLWAVTHIGPHSRGRSLRAPVLVTSGPYAVVRHPLYAGNLLVCAGLLVLTRSFPPWFPILFGLLFLMQYGLFMWREEAFLNAEWGNSWQAYREGRNAGISGPVVDREALRREWPTLRTVLGLVGLIGLKVWLFPR